MNERLARRHWKSEDPVGRRISSDGGRTWRTIVGVVGDVRQQALDAEYTDTVIQGQGQPDLLELHFPYTGRYMFHAHKSEFAALGWMGFFEVTE